MTSNLIYAVGTLLTWIGWFLFFRAVVFGAQLLVNAPGMDAKRVQSGLVKFALGGAVCLGLVAATPMHADPGAVKAAMRFPLVWFVMPWTGWLAAASAIMAVVRTSQGLLAINPTEKLERGKAAALWAVALGVFVWLYQRDPANKIEILKGGIGLTPTSAGAIVLLAVAGAVVMTLTGRAAATRGFAKAIVTQLALIAGSIVFGLPFAFLVITSFKEDRDMSSAHGIVWIPKVQETVPYMSPKNPYYEASYEGQRVEVQVIETHPDGTVKADIQKPMAIRGVTFEAPQTALKQIPQPANVWSGTYNGQAFTGFVVEDLDDGSKRLQFMDPAALKGQQAAFKVDDLQPVRHIGLRVQNYPDALDYLPPETNRGLVYLKNTLLIVVFSVIGTVLSSSLVAYAFSRMQFPGRNALFAVLLSTMMLPAAVTLMPQFLIFRSLGWIDTLYPLWVPAFFGSAFNIFLLRQFFMQIPMELEDAAKIDGCNYAKTFWDIMMPQIKPALAVIAIWTFMGAWNNFMGPLIYVNSPENMPLSYALQLFQGDRTGEPGLLMAFATLCMLPVLALFFFAQRYFIEGVTLSGLGGR